MTEKVELEVDFAGVHLTATITASESTLDKLDPMMRRWEKLLREIWRPRILYNRVKSQIRIGPKLHKVPQHRRSA